MCDFVLTFFGLEDENDKMVAKAEGAIRKIWCATKICSKDAANVYQYMIVISVQ